MTPVSKVAPGTELARQHAEHLERVRRNFAGNGPKRPPAAKAEVTVVPDRTVRVATFEVPVRVLAPAIDAAPAVEAIEVVTKSLSVAMPTALLIHKPSVDLIIRVGCRHFGLSKSDILADRRSQPIVRWRQIIIFVIKDLTKRSLPDIGRRVGGRDHTTILHAIRQIESMMAGGDQSITDHVAALRAEVSAELAHQYAARHEVSENRTENQTMMGECNGTSCDAV